MQRRPQGEIKQRMVRVLELVESTGLENRAPIQLSGGQQQRVALARALIMEPKVQLMDEPLSNLDAKLREQMRTEIRRIQKRLGITGVYVTHDQVEAMTLSDCIVVMNAGKIEQIGTPTEIYRRPQTRFGRFHRAGQLCAGRRARPPRRPSGSRRTGRHAERTSAHGEFRSGETVTLVMRPEIVEIDSPQAQVEGIVRRSAYLGNIVEYDVEVSGQMLTLVEHDPRRTAIHSEGQSVRIRFLEECLYVLPK